MLKGSLQKRLTFFNCLIPSSLQLWVKERMPMAVSTDHGKDLPTVQLLIKKNQVGFARWDPQGFGEGERMAWIAARS